MTVSPVLSSKLPASWPSRLRPSPTPSGNSVPFKFDPASAPPAEPAFPSSGTAPWPPQAPPIFYPPLGGGESAPATVLPALARVLAGKSGCKRRNSAGVEGRIRFGRRSGAR